MITGHEAGYVRTVTFSVLCRVVGFLLIVPSFGILGAAIVTASILAIMSFYLNGQCRSKTGIDFSIFRLVRKQKDALPAHLRSTKSKNVTPASSLCSTPAE
jgi:O-antigen/teichoic acid export membrane protein